MIDAYKRVLVGQYELPESRHAENLLEDSEVQLAAAGTGAGRTGTADILHLPGLPALQESLLQHGIGARDLRSDNILD